MSKYYLGKLLTKAIKSIPRSKKVSPDIKSVKPGKNLTKKRKHQDDVIKTRDKIIKEYGITDPKVKTDLRTKANQPKINKKIADIQDRARVKKMGGGMMGRRFGYKGGKLVGKQSIIAKQAGDPKKIESVDFKVLQAKNKKKVI